MNRFESNNLMTARRRTIPDSPGEFPLADYSSMRPIRSSNSEYMLDVFRILIGGRLEKPAVDAVSVGWAGIMPTSSGLTVTTAVTEAAISPAPIVYINEDIMPNESAPNFQAVIDQLPVAKRAELEKALSKIMGYLVDIEASEDGEVIIETKEDGLDCFYAICTEEGDFKGTWLADGRLRKQPWSANPPYGQPALSLA
jgi:hypothetical protein